MSLELPRQLAQLSQAAVRPAVVVENAVPVLLGPEAGGAPAEVRDHLGPVADHLVRVQPHLAAPRRPDRLPPQRPDLLLHHPERDVLQAANRVAVERGLEPAAARAEERVVVPREEVEVGRQLLVVELLEPEAPQVVRDRKRPSGDGSRRSAAADSERSCPRRSESSPAREPGEGEARMNPSGSGTSPAGGTLM